MAFIWLFMFLCMGTCTSLDSLSRNGSLHDGQTLVSESGAFEAGFFSPGSTKGRYLGVWYRNVTPLLVVWVANREIPVKYKSGVLKFNEKGILVIHNGTKSTVWSSNVSSKAVTTNASMVQLLDSGNLVVRNEHDSNKVNFLWQSFDYPGNSLLPGMKLGWNLETGLEKSVTSWKSDDDPAKGEYSMKFDLKGCPQLYYWKGNVIMIRKGHWNGVGFTGYPSFSLTQIFRYEYVMNEKELYFEYETINKSVLSFIKMIPSGRGQRFLWNYGGRGKPEVIASGGADQCENYNWCGANAICNMIGNDVSCACMKGFVPKFPAQWNISYWADGCVRSTKLDCINQNGFMKYTRMKLPDTNASWFSKTMNLEECRKSCLKNCSCSAYANLDVRAGGSGCLLWFHDLIDMKTYVDDGQDLYFRVPSSEQDHIADNNNHEKLKELLAIIGAIVAFGLTTCACTMIRKRQVMARKTKLIKEDIDLPIFDFPIIVKATENFSHNKKLGQGGYGPVYKGTLSDGQEIAVKRLSKKSRQGVREFKNEVALIAKLQHRNLVKLIGCCIHGEEKMLIYEYMPNKSLDHFIFDETRRKLLDWPKYFNIISGIARGLLYLQQDSRLKIIHRDLKASNILLDANLTPKISDFGLARIFSEDQDEENTNRVAGTYGYISPEYAMHGRFSLKSDVFSYGVIVLEIISGKKIREFSDSEHNHNLLAHAWRLWSEERALEFLDEMLRGRCTAPEVVRCIQVGLLCVQQIPQDRPDMSSMVLMLNGDKPLPKPKVPGFYTEKEPQADALGVQFSDNKLSISSLEPR